jgi:hypothetical protein
MVDEDGRKYTDYSMKLIRKETAKAKDGMRAIITACGAVNPQGQPDKVLEGRVILVPDITFNGPNREPQSSYLVHTVRYQDLFCSCGRFQNNKFPCSHTCCLILKAGRNIFDYMGQFWDCYSFQSAYNYGLRITGTFDGNGKEIGYLATIRTIVLDEVRAEFFHDQITAPPLEPVRPYTCPFFLYRGGIPFTAPFLYAPYRGGKGHVRGLPPLYRAFGHFL